MSGQASGSRPSPAPKGRRVRTRSTAAETRRRKEGAPAPPAGSAARIASPPEAVRGAAVIPPSAAARRASLAGCREGRPRRRGTRPGAPPGRVGGAAAPRRTGDRGARPALSWKPSASTRTAGTKRRGGDTGLGAPTRAVPIATRRARACREVREVREPQPCGVGLVPRAAGLSSATFTVVLLGTDETLGVFDDEMEVAAFLAFEKLGPGPGRGAGRPLAHGDIDGVTPAPAGLRDLSAVHSNRRPVGILAVLGSGVTGPPGRPGGTARNSSASLWAVSPGVAIAAGGFAPRTVSRPFPRPRAAETAVSEEKLLRWAIGTGSSRPRSGP